MFVLVRWSGIRNAVGVLMSLSACQDVHRDQLDAGPGDDASVSADDAMSVDAYTLPGTMVRVSSTGDDANDGVTKPVKTLKRATDIAARFPEITSISVGAGRYGAATGEAYPYTVRSNVRVFGPFGGGAVLAGNKTESGIILESGKIEDLTLEDFAVAVVARGLGAIENVHVRTSGVAVHAEAAAELTLNNLDVDGTDGACAMGIELVGDAVLTATELTTHGLGTSLQVRDQGSATLARANITGDGSCISNTISIQSNKTFTLIDSILDGGFAGLTLSSFDTPLQASLTNVIIRNTRTGALGGSNANAHVTGGELSHNASTGLRVASGNWVLTNVTVKDNSSGIHLLGRRDREPVRLVMRGCTVSGNQQGVDVFDFATVDLGTTASPGNNVLQSNQGVGLSLGGEDGQRQIDAVGNIWRPLSQGADNAGRYSNTTKSGPISYAEGNNFTISSSLWSLKL